MNNRETDKLLDEARGGVLAGAGTLEHPVAVACGLLGAALATGHVVVHKPSERCPDVGRLLTELMARHLPAQVLTCLDGDGRVGAALARHPEVDLIAHVGSTATGLQVASAAARNRAKVLLENGGNDPLIVDSGVDRDGPRPRPPWGRSVTRDRSVCRWNGSTCTGTSRRSSSTR